MSAAPVLAFLSKAHTADANVRRLAERSPMIRISLSYVYNYAQQIEGLAALPVKDRKLDEIFIELFNAKLAIDAMHSSMFGPYLVTSYQSHKTLIDALNSYFEKYDPAKVLPAYEIATLKQLFEQYRIAFLAEVGVLNAYFVTQKAGFDTRSLLLWGENCFPADLKAKVPEALYDAREAAKCLAYEQATACGFHVFRALESVLRRYHSAVTGGVAPPKVRNIGVYIDSLRRTKKGNLKILASLTQIKDLHRNPLIHPEAVFSVEDAIGALGIVRSVMAAMLDVLPVAPATTITASPLLANP